MQSMWTGSSSSSSSRAAGSSIRASAYAAGVRRSGSSRLQQLPDETLPLPPALQEIAPLFLDGAASTSRFRFFVVEFVGTFIVTMMSNLLVFRWFLKWIVNFHLENPGRAPVLELACIRFPADPGESQCSGTVTSPLAGIATPFPGIMMALLTGAIFAICSIAAPGATLNPSFTLALCLGQMRSWSSLAPSIFGQFFGAMTAVIFLYLLTFPTISAVAHGWGWPEQAMTAMMETMYGLSYPDEMVGNRFAFRYAVLNGITVVALMTPMSVRTMHLHPLVQDLAKGLVIGSFGSAFGGNGLGSMPNPAQWMAAAFFMHGMGYTKDAWSRHDDYAFKVPLFGPTVGVIFGSVLFMMYMCALYLPGKSAAASASAEESTESAEDDGESAE